MKICMDCGEVEMFDVDAQKSFEKCGHGFNVKEKLMRKAWYE